MWYNVPILALSQFVPSSGDKGRKLGKVVIINDTVMLSVILVGAILGVALWLLFKYVPMQPPLPTVITVVAVILYVLWALSGPLGAVLPRGVL